MFYFLFFCQLLIAKVFNIETFSFRWPQIVKKCDMCNLSFFKEITHYTNKALKCFDFNGTFSYFSLQYAGIVAVDSICFNCSKGQCFIVGMWFENAEEKKFSVPDKCTLDSDWPFICSSCVLHCFEVCVFPFKKGALCSWRICSPVAVNGARAGA